MNELGGSDVLAPGYLYHYTLDATQAGAFLIGTAHPVIDALHPFDDTLNDPQRLAEQASRRASRWTWSRCTSTTTTRSFPAIGRLPGVVVTPQAECCRPTPTSRRPSSVR